MNEVRYFLGSQFAPVGEWDEVSEETYRIVRQNAKLREDIFKSDSRDDIIKETFFEGVSFLCGAKITPTNPVLRSFYPNAPRKCVNDTDGDGDCAACARNPESSCRQVSWEDLPPTVVRSRVAEQKAEGDKK